jgi:hypothetical protein
MATLKEDVLIVAGVAVAVLALAYYVKRKAGQIIPEVAPLLNPFDDRNIAYTSTNSFLGLLAGQKDFSIGVAAYDATHGGALDVASENNAAYRTANWAWEKVGVLDKDETIGTKIYDWLH